MIVIRFLQFLVALIVVRLFSRALGAFFGQPRSRPATRTSGVGAGRRPVSGGELVHDRICNTHLPKERALVARVGGEREYFCSEACRDKALAAWSRAS